jgi:hypothetical protein
MTLKTLMLMVPVLAALVACSQGYTPERDGSRYNGFDSYNSYGGGEPMPAVMPDDRARARDY